MSEGCRPVGDAARRIALVLPGGGARSAYQVGALKALAQLMPRDAGLPFRIVCGTSAGAILAAVLVGHADRFRQGTVALERVWGRFHVEQVLRADTVTMLRSGLHVLLALVSGGWLRSPPRALFDATPLRRLLERRVNTVRVRQALDAGALEALAIGATSYASARSVAFVQAARPVTPLVTAAREIRPMEQLSHDHLMASAAIPFVFAPVDIAGEPFGDGGMRQSAPLSVAARLGANRVLVIGVRSESAVAASLRRPAPGFGELFGFMLDALFHESLRTDIEHLERINSLLTAIRDDARPHGLQCIEPMVLTPGSDLSAIARRHAGELPRTLRVLLRTMGARGAGSGQLLSYLLFEQGYTRALIRLGYAETMARRVELDAFLGAATGTAASSTAGEDTVL